METNQPPKSVGQSVRWFVLVVVIGGGLLSTVVGIVWFHFSENRNKHLPVEVFPPRPNDAGEVILPYHNPATREKAIKAAFFQVIEPTHPDGIGEARPPTVIRFEAKHYDSSDQHWGKRIDDIVLRAGEASAISVYIVDAKRAGERVFGYLSLQCEDGELIRSEPYWVSIHAK